MAEEPVLNVLNDRFVPINENHNFWTYKDVFETHRHIIHKPTYSVEDGKLTLSEGVDERRKIISVFNTVERLNKHPSISELLETTRREQRHAVYNRHGFITRG